MRPMLLLALDLAEHLVLAQHRLWRVAGAPRAATLLASLIVTRAGGMPR